MSKLYLDIGRPVHHMSYFSILDVTSIQFKL